ncbi:hypothetical protein FACS189415_2450 [Bacteroidia bacterium]|nr:hypothetical protein FACS18947_2860 [Bacteroidia bacterium]GHU82282.1 hypothetical protein FACS189415_2450 [Bacteroidia bacterium]
MVLASATVLEKFQGSEAVHEWIYGAWWFVILWAILGISSSVYIFSVHRTLFRPQFTRILFHCSLVIILLGALITYLTADRGYVHIRQGEIANFYISEEDAVKRPLPFDIKLLLFDIEYHSGTDEPADYISFIKVDEEVSRISMNKIFKQQGYRFYQMDYDPDEMGTVLSVNHDPWGIVVTYTGYLLLAVSMLALLFIRIGRKGLLYTLIPVAGLWYYISQLNPMTPVLRSPLLAIHVSVIMIAYLLLLVIMIISIVGLSSGKLRKKLSVWNTLLLYPALFLLSAGIFIGAVWANISWGRYWGWDAKETWALITLLIYALPLHKGSFPFFRNPKKFHIYCVIAFFSILMTFFGVSYFLGGVHSYV